MIEFEIDGKSFRFEKLTAMQQFHVSRKIAPLIPPLFPIAAQITKDQEKSKKKTLLDLDLNALGPLVQPFTDSLAEMTDETSEYVFSTCLSVVRYKHGENWIPMWNAQGKVAMVIELNDVALLLRIVVRVITESMAPFISRFLTSAEEPDTEELRSDPSPVTKTGS